jgi:hypothetical protein
MTSAARVTRLSASPCATAASVRMEQGAITMPSQPKLPLAIEAPTSAASCMTSASAPAAKSAGVMPSSCATVRQPEGETTRCDSMPPALLSACNVRKP